MFKGRLDIQGSEIFRALAEEVRMMKERAYSNFCNENNCLQEKLATFLEEKKNANLFGRPYRKRQRKMLF